MTEFNLIYEHINTQSFTRPDVIKGIGDDCAILKIPEGYSLAVSMDTLVSGVHFPETASAYSIGYKSLAVNLSDLASAGAIPAWITLSLTLPKQDNQWLDQFLAGLFDLAKKYNVQLVGGDTCQGPLSISIQAHGFVKNALLRSTASEGDLIYVSGFLGDASIGFDLLESNESDFNHCVTRFHQPEPRIDLGLKLADIATACIDISDGLVSDLQHICDSSSCGADIRLNKIPLSDEFLSYYNNEPEYRRALSFGDDYELCFTVKPASINRIKEISEKLSLPLSCIGEITAASNIQFLDSDNKNIDIKNKGYQHFNE